MAKFVLECPACGKYVEASDGFFAKKKINCVCDNVINVKTEKMTSKLCNHCKNIVVYDQSKGNRATCPVCHEKMYTTNDMKSIIEFTCPTCNCTLSADKSLEAIVCPLCETNINIETQIIQNTNRKKGFASVIKYEGNNDTFVWKHPIEDFNLGSQLIVHESQEAIFFRDGKALDLFGPGRHTLETQNLPIVDNLHQLLTSTEEVFHCEVYFINMTTQMGIKWGTDSKVRFFDPGSGMHIEIGASGQFNMQVSDSRKLLLKLVGTERALLQKDILGQDAIGIAPMIGKFKALVTQKVKLGLVRTIKELNISILEIDEYLDVLSENMRISINEILDEYGLFMPEFYITSIVTPDEDPNFRRLKQQFADKVLLTRDEEIYRAEARLEMVKAQGEAEIKKIKAQGDAEAHKIQAFAEAAEMQAKGYTYQQETARHVGMEAMKNGITSGSGGSGLGEIAGFGVALGAIGEIANMTKEAMVPICTEGREHGRNVLNASEAENNSERIEHSGDELWECSCGVKNISSRFCPDCGAKKPEPITKWDCVCGLSGIHSRFCPDCGTKRPERPAKWNCSCGSKNISSKFCPDCGKERDE